MALAIMLALLPLVELLDHWESFGSDPEFVSVCTILGIAFGLLAALRRAIRYYLTRLLPVRFALSAGAVLHASRPPLFKQSSLGYEPLSGSRHILPWLAARTAVLMLGRRWACTERVLTGQAL